jgi:hypothetical protein
MRPRGGWKFPFFVALVIAPVILHGCASGDDGQGKDVVIVGAPVNIEELTGQNLTEFHLRAGAQNYSLCIVCHGDKSAETAVWDPSFDAPHKIHAERTRLACTSCHVSVDLLQHSGAQLRHQVATEICAQCHGGQGPGVKLFLTGL